MRAITVCVNYADYLRITLPYNAHHFTDVLVVTTCGDAETQHVAKEFGAEVFCTDAFHRDGRLFGKWLALEEALQEFGRYGWLCLLDADILWPQEAEVPQQRGTLLCPYRRMHSCSMCNGLGNRNPSQWRTVVPETCTCMEENKWTLYPRHRNIHEWAGYSTVFHAEDAGPAPWFDVAWMHAGGGDTEFQAKWQRKTRPTWECLHLGPACHNWCGIGNQDLLRQLLLERRRRGDYSAEKLT